MRSRVPALFAAAVLAVPALGTASTDVSSDSRAGSTEELRAAAAAVAAYGAQPVRFEPNLGQAPAEVRFVAHGPRFTAALTASEFTVVVANLREPSHEALDAEGIPPEDVEPPVLAAGLRLRGGNWAGAIDVGPQLPGASNYLKGERSSWVRSVPGFESLSCRDVYPGIDVAFRGTAGDIEYDVIVNPGADPRAVQVELEGSAPFHVDEQGSIVMVSDAGTIRHSAPTVYQEADGARIPVSGRYVENGAGVFGIEVESFDGTRPLVIDPVLSFSTYLGGGAVDGSLDIDVDREGRFYVCGYTQSTDFANYQALQTTNHGSYDATLTKFTQGESPVLVYSTYLGGTALDQARRIEVDRMLNAVVIGTTSSVDFPTVNPLQVDTGDAATDCFVAKLDPEGDDLEFSTYLGGTGMDVPGAVAVDTLGNITVTGTTFAGNFPTLRAVQPIPGGAGDAFVTGIEPDGSALRFSTYLGGSANDFGYGVAVGDDFGIVVAGATESANFPRVNALQSAFGGVRDCFVTKLGSSGGPVQYSTFLGGSSADECSMLSIVGSSAVLGGITMSADYPTYRALQGDRPNTDGFVSIVARDGQSLEFSTYLGGSAGDYIYGLDTGADGHVVVCGGTTSPDFPVLNFVQTDPDGSVFDAFAAEIDPTVPALVFSTYLGGASSDLALGAAVSGSGSVYVTGYTESTNFPTQNPTGTDPGDGLSDIFVVRLGLPHVDLALESVEFSPNPVVYGRTAHVSITVRNQGPDRAGDTTVKFLLVGLEFSSYSMTQGDAAIQTLVPGYHLVTCYFGSIEAGSSATVTANGTVPSETIAEVEVSGIAGSSALELIPMTNEFTVSVPVVVITPPEITAISSLVIEGKPYRIRITGSNFQPGVQVFVAMDATPWPKVKYKNTSTLILKGSDLKQRFPKGVAVQVRVVNPDTGFDSATFVR